MDHRELDEQLAELGVRIPEGTLTRWAAEGLIPSPSAYFKKKERRLGRPSSKKEAEDHNEWGPGRFMDWPDEAVEIAAAVWALRNRPEPSGYQVLQPPRKRKRNVPHQRKRKRNVPNDTVMLVEQEGKKLHNLLETDCKEASLFLRSAMNQKGTLGVEDYNKVRVWVKHFSEHSVYALVILWIWTIEKARRRIPLNEQLHLEYRWVIRENGQMSFEGLTTGDATGGIELEVTHLEPMHNGFSVDYGFPQVDIFKKQGFLDRFKLYGTEWEERYRIHPKGGPYNVDDESDPEGYADWLAEIEYDDFY